MRRGYAWARDWGMVLLLFSIIETVVGMVIWLIGFATLWCQENGKKLTRQASPVLAG